MPVYFAPQRRILLIAALIALLLGSMLLAANLPVYCLPIAKLCLQHNN